MQPLVGKRGLGCARSEMHVRKFAGAVVIVEEEGSIIEKSSQPSPPSRLDSHTHRCSCCPAPERSRYLELSVIIPRRSTVADGIIHRIETWNSGLRGFNFSN